LAHKPVQTAARTWTGKAPAAGRASANGHSGDAPSDATRVVVLVANDSHHSLLRRVGTAGTAVMLIALVGSELSVTGVRAWWDATLLRAA
jgi:hypothetical protein